MIACAEWESSSQQVVDTETNAKTRNRGRRGRTVLQKVFPIDAVVAIMVQFPESAGIGDAKVLVDKLSYSSRYSSHPALTSRAHKSVHN